MKYIIVGICYWLEQILSVDKLLQSISVLNIAFFYIPKWPINMPMFVNSRNFLSSMNI